MWTQPSLTSTSSKALGTMAYMAIMVFIICQLTMASCEPITDVQKTSGHLSNVCLDCSTPTTVYTINRLNNCQIKYIPQTTQTQEKKVFHAKLSSLISNLATFQILGNIGGCLFLLCILTHT